MSELKLFYTVCATLLMYGLGSYMQLGSFVLPLPFFEIGLFLICIYFAITVWVQNKTLSLLLIVYGIAQLLSLEYNYSFFLSDQNLEWLSDSILTDLFKIFAHLLLLPVLYFQNKKGNFLSNSLSFWITSVIILVCLFLPSPLWLLIPILYLIITIQKNGSIFTNSLSFWLYIPLFILARELSLYFL